MTPSLRLAVLCLGLVLTSSLAEARPTITIFDVPGADPHSGGGTLPNAMNANGDVTGFYTTKDSRRGFIRTADGGYVTFVAKHHAQTFPFAINDAGTVTGGFRPNIGAPRGFVRFADGSVTIFQAPGADGSFYGTEPIAIDDAGRIGGYFEDVSGVLHGFLRAPDGTFATFEAPDSGSDPGEGTFVTNMNSKAHVLGYSFDSDAGQFGFTRSAKGRKFVQFAPPGATLTSPQGININGVITGFYTGADEVWHGFAGTPDGGFASFDAPNSGTLAGTGTSGYTINKYGVVAGFTIDSAFAYHGFLRSPSGGIVPIDIDGAGTGSNQGTIAETINDAGVTMGFYTDANDVNHGFLRTQD